jgi:tetratricopeptide (TPR) repeat protein
MNFIVVTLSFLLFAQAHALPLAEEGNTVSKTKDTYKDVIQKSQNLTLQHERLQAAQSLVQAIQSDSYGKKATEELKKTLNDISTMFYLEKTQKVFEYAKSLMRESPQEASEKYSQAIKAEPDNILILLWMARLSLYLGKCEDAKQSIIKAQEINPFYAQLELAELQSIACLQSTELLNKAVADHKQLEQIYPLYYHMVMVQKFFTQKQYPEANYHIERAKEIDKEFPEIYYWESQILEKQELNFKDSASRYIKDCKTIAKADYLKYELEPRLCQQYKTFENEYKSVLEQENKKDM